MALGDIQPWRVTDVKFDPKERRLDMYLDYARNTKFTCPVCGRPECRTYDSEEKTWRHLDFFQYTALIHARVPRCDCKNCGTVQVTIPWARERSGFTLLFETYILLLVSEMPVKAVARMVREHDTRLWRVIKHYVDEARSKEDYSDVAKVAVDETSREKHHVYVSIFADANTGKVLFATPGKDASTLERFSDDFFAHNGNPACIEEFTCDMSPAFIKGILSEFEDVNITFDKFHVMKALNEAVDEVRRQEQHEVPELKRSRYVWLKNASDLNTKEQETLDSLTRMNLKTAKAYQMKLTFQSFWEQPVDMAEVFLKRWYNWAIRSRLEPIKDFAKMVKDHWDGILRWFESRITTGKLEGINSIMQAVKRRARGYRSVENFITMIYLVRGQLALPSLV